VIKDLLEPMKSCLETFLDSATETGYETCTRHYLYYWPEPIDRPARILCQLTERLRRAKLYPFPEPESYPHTIRDLYDELQAVLADALKHQVLWPLRSQKCPACIGHDEMKKAIEGVFYDRPFIQLDGAQKSHLWRRKEESGIREGLPSVSEWKFYNTLDEDT
jgi:hypothetical protein